mgnify:CR=1 FL=1
MSQDIAQTDVHQIRGSGKTNDSALIVRLADLFGFCVPWLRAVADVALIELLKRFPFLDVVSPNLFQRFGDGGLYPSKVLRQAIGQTVINSFHRLQQVRRGGD